MAHSGYCIFEPKTAVFKISVTLKTEKRLQHHVYKWNWKMQFGLILICGTTVGAMGSCAKVGEFFELHFTSGW